MADKYQVKIITILDKVLRCTKKYTTLEEAYEAAFKHKGTFLKNKFINNTYDKLCEFNENGYLVRPLMKEEGSEEYDADADNDEYVRDQKGNYIMVKCAQIPRDAEDKPVDISCFTWPNDDVRPMSEDELTAFSVCLDGELFDLNYRHIVDVKHRLEMKTDKIVTLWYSSGNDGLPTTFCWLYSESTV